MIALDGLTGVCGSDWVKVPAPEAAALLGGGHRARSTGGTAQKRPGEERHLTQKDPLHAPGMAGQGVGPEARKHLPGLPHGECGEWGGTPRFWGRFGDVFGRFNLIIWN